MRWNPNCFKCFDWFLRVFKNRDGKAKPSTDAPVDKPITQEDIWQMWGDGVDPPKAEQTVRCGDQIIDNDKEGYNKWEGRSKTINGSTANVWAASCRGRSHARVGKFRDDSFDVRYLEKSGWYILAVADGAGSAKYSRKGSEIACRVSADKIQSLLEAGILGEEFERDCVRIQDEAGKPLNEKNVRLFSEKYLYRLLAEAAFDARREIQNEVKEMNKTPGQSVSERDYHTTLLLTVCRKIKDGKWFIGSFSIGDGLIGLYAPEQFLATKLHLMNHVDSGEYAGDTSFLTSSKAWDVSKDPHKVIRRFSAVVVDDFTALLSMTDGVSDAIFQTNRMLKDVNCWNDFWRKLNHGEGKDFSSVDFRNKNAHEELLKWLEFRVPGYHDDRTLVILQPKK